MYLRCRPPSNAHDLKEVCSSSFSSLAIQLRQHRRHLSQHRGPQPQTQERREARKKARQSLTSHRLFRALSTLPNAPYNVAVIGGGITGLTAAFKISQDPNAKVTLYESSSKLGGWMKETERVKVNGGEVLFEYGPRSFRASTEMGYSTSNLLLDLGLKDQLLLTGKYAPAALNRYIYHRGGLLRLPNPIRAPRTNPLVTIFLMIVDILSKPIFRDILWQAIRETIGLKPKEPQQRGDESLSDFFTRKLGACSVDNIFSALTHGVYAGDVDKLSFKAIAYPQWFVYQKFPGFSMGFAELSKRKLALIKGEDHDAIVLAVKDRAQLGERPGRVEEIQEVMKDINSFVLKGGMVQLVDHLGGALADAKNVEVKTNVQIEKISGSYKSPMEVQLADGSSQQFNHVISTTSPSQLAKQIQGPSDATSPANDTVQQLSSGLDYAVNVMVVNIFYEKPNLLPVEGFGYLIPRATPLSMNPERALGVIFGAEAESTRNTAQGTHLTVMLGGHWWDGWKERDFPDEQSAIEMGHNLVKRHLNISETPAVARARLQRNAIPQPTVGHYDRMAQLDGAIRRDYGDNLKVGGAWYTGVSINDCTRAGSLLGLRLRHREEGGSAQTGLGTFSAPDRPTGVMAPLRYLNLEKFWMAMKLREKGINPPPEGLRPTTSGKG